MAAGLHVGVVGGSITGCSVAAELAAIGCEVTLFERSGEALKDRGAGIGVPTTVLETFIADGLVDADLPHFPAPAFLRLTRTAGEPRYGRLAWRQPAKMAALNWGALYRNLRARVPSGAYRTRRQVVGCSAFESRPTLHFVDGSEAAFDLVVFADGYQSLGRQLLFPDAKLHYAGYVLWRGQLPESALDESPPLEVGIRCVGYPGGHGIFYFVPGGGNSVAAGQRLVNWGVYVQVPANELGEFMTDREGVRHDGSLPPGMMPPATEASLKARIAPQMPDYYAAILEDSQGTYAYGIYDCLVPAYRRGRVCLAGDAGAFARPHTGAGAQKGINDAVALRRALAGGTPLEEALTAWDAERTEANNQAVRFGMQIGEALVLDIPDWSTMDEAAMEAWFSEVVTIRSDYLLAR